MEQNFERKYIKSKYFFIKDENAIGYVGENKTSFYLHMDDEKHLGEYSFSLFNSEIVLIKDKVAIRIKEENVDGTQKEMRIYEEIEEGGYFTIPTLELIDHLAKDNRYELYVKPFNKKAALIGKITKNLPFEVKE